MADRESSQTDDPALIEERFIDILPDESQRQQFLRLVGQLESDNAALIILKGHLVIEERLTSVIEKFVFHPEHLEQARLTFAHKLAIARSLSLDEDKNSMWSLIKKLNALRNTLSHSLDGESRIKAMEAVKSAYVAECSGQLNEYEGDDTIMLAGVIAACLGFVHAMEQEVERFREHVGMMDRVVNPHRHKE
jgi:hypothetical protein